MQLTKPLRSRAVRFCASLLAWTATCAFSTSARAQVAEVNTTHALFHEAPSGSKMTVYTPGASVKAMPFSWLDVRAGWEADIVSGASVSVKAGPAYQATHPSADVISSASVHDTRHVARGGFTLRKDIVSFSGGYAYGTENDYRSHAMTVSARTEPYDRNTQLEITYSRNFDSVCDRTQSPTDTASRFRALEDSTGCFTSHPLRTTRKVDGDVIQGGWTQAWTPVFNTQLVYTLEILHGFQSNPYRSVIVGEGLKAQEHVPEDRSRHAVALRGNYFLRPLKAALKLSLRGYWDTWNIKAGTAEAELEKIFGESLRVAARGRYYQQTGALFFSDDYTAGAAPLGPKGQYFTGDREHSPFSSWLVGGRMSYAIVAEQGRVLSLFTSVRAVGSFDVSFLNYDEFTLGGRPITNARAYVGVLGLTAAF